MRPGGVKLAHRSPQPRPALHGPHFVQAGGAAGCSSISPAGHGEAHLERAILVALAAVIAAVEVDAAGDPFHLASADQRRGHGRRGAAKGRRGRQQRQLVGWQRAAVAATSSDAAQGPLGQMRRAHTVLSTHLQMHKG